MDWQKLITELCADSTLQEVGDVVGLSKMSVCDIRAGRQKTVRWEVGDAIIKLHRKTIKQVRKPCAPKEPT